MHFKVHPPPAPPILTNPPLSLRVVTGLGMNADELAANGALHRRLVQDLNATPSLPFETGSFDLVTCALSVDYLTRPMEVGRGGVIVERGVRRYDGERGGNDESG